MIKVGITGGIGSGKSMICKVYSRLRVPVYYADIEARLLMDYDPEIQQNLETILGAAFFDHGILNRNRMASAIFDDKSLLDKVNKLIHPRVADHFSEWCNRHAGFPYILQESAILFESNAYRNFDKIITVTAPEEIRIQRVIDRENMTPEKVAAIMRNQLPEEEKISRSHHVIVNDGTELVIPQVLKLHNMFKENYRTLR
ncbi:MAG: dephospho-CoA kinase [Prolixibacteraceae bacterium]|nr:dephospho-CoA kinase [Prolixibacteraceae bacterium]